MALLDLKEATQFQNVILELSHYFLPKALLQVTAPQHRVSNSASKAVTTPGVQGFMKLDGSRLL